jgi:hypothetical protein
MLFSMKRSFRSLVVDGDVGRRIRLVHDAGRRVVCSGGTGGNDVVDEVVVDANFIRCPKRDAAGTGPAFEIVNDKVPNRDPGYRAHDTHPVPAIDASGSVSVELEPIHGHVDIGDDQNGSVAAGGAEAGTGSGDAGMTLAHPAHDLRSVSGGQHDAMSGVCQVAVDGVAGGAYVDGSVVVVVKDPGEIDTGSHGSQIEIRDMVCVT